MAQSGTDLAAGGCRLRLRRNDSPGAWDGSRQKGCGTIDSVTIALPDDMDALKAALAAERAERIAAQALAAAAQAKLSDDQALIAQMKLEIEKLRRELYGQRSERSKRLLDQMELQLEELETSASEDELLAEMAAAKTTRVAAFTRKRPAHKPFPEHLPRERVIVPGPTSCACCGGARLSKLGEDVTETLEVIPRQWKVIQHVREKFSCRDCETIAQAPAPFHVIPRGWAGPSLLAMILFEKFGQHQPLNRQAERYAREGVPLSLSTLADQVGACCVVLDPIFRRLEAHVLAAGRLHGDDTTVPVLAKGKTDTGRSWVYVRDDRPFGGKDLEAWMRKQRAKLSRGNDVAKAMDYLLKRWAAFTRFLDDGRICLSNNAAERALRGIALGRKSWLFAGSDRSGQRAAVMYSLIVTAKMNDIDPQAWLADVLARIAEHPAKKLDELLPWNWRPLNARANQAA